MTPVVLRRTWWHMRARYEYLAQLRCGVVLDGVARSRAEAQDFAELSAIVHGLACTDDRCRELTR